MIIINQDTLDKCVITNRVGNIITYVSLTVPVNAKTLLLTKRLIMNIYFKMTLQKECYIIH